MHFAQSATELHLPILTQSYRWLRMGAHILEGYRAHANNCTLLIRELKCQSGEIFPFTETNQCIVAFGKNMTLWDTFSFQYYCYLIATDGGPKSALH